MTTPSDVAVQGEKENSGNIDVDGTASSGKMIESTSTSCISQAVGAPPKQDLSGDTNNGPKVSPSQPKRVASTVHGDDSGLKRPKKDYDENGVVTASTASIAIRSSSVASATTEKKESSDKETSTTKTLDLAELLGLKAGDRLEVQWEVHNEDDDDVGDGDGGDRDDPPSTKTVWWKATLLEHDGRTTDSVAIRVLDYDPQPEMGFPDRSQEDVVFLGQDLLVSPDDDSIQLTFRREGETEQDQVFWYTEENLDEQLNNILLGALHKNEAAWKALPAAAQATIAEKIHKKKEELKERLRSQKQVITPETIREILAQAF